MHMAAGKRTGTQLATGAYHAKDMGLPSSSSGRKYPLMQRSSQTQIWMWLLAAKPAFW